MRIFCPIVFSKSLLIRQISRRCRTAAGAPLARAEAQITIPLLFERFPCLLLDPQYGIEHKNAPVFNGVRALWVRTA
jgi:cytochrome P450